MDITRFQVHALDASTLLVILDSPATRLTWPGASSRRSAIKVTSCNVAGHDATLHGQHAAAFGQRAFKTARHGCHRGDEQIAKAMAVQTLPHVEAILEELCRQRLAIGQRGNATAKVARRQHAQLAPQSPRRPAVVGQPVTMAVMLDVKSFNPRNSVDSPVPRRWRQPWGRARADDADRLFPPPALSRAARTALTMTG